MRPYILVCGLSNCYSKVLYTYEIRIRPFNSPSHYLGLGEWFNDTADNCDNYEYNDELVRQRWCVDQQCDDDVR